MHDPNGDELDLVYEDLRLAQAEIARLRAAQMPTPTPTPAQIEAVDKIISSCLDTNASNKDIRQARMEIFAALSAAAEVGGANTSPQGKGPTEATESTSPASEGAAVRLANSPTPAQIEAALIELLSGHDNLYRAHFAHLPTCDPLDDIATHAARSVLAALTAAAEVGEAEEIEEALKASLGDAAAEVGCNHPKGQSKTIYCTKCGEYYTAAAEVEVTDPTWDADYIKAKANTEVDAARKAERDRTIERCAQVAKEWLDGDDLRPEALLAAIRALKDK